MASKTQEAAFINQPSSHHLRDEGESFKEFLISNRIGISEFAHMAKKSRGWVYETFRQKEIPLQTKLLVEHLFQTSFETILSKKFEHNSNEQKKENLMNTELDIIIEDLKQSNSELKERIAFLEEMLKSNLKVINLQSDIIERKITS